MNSYFVKTKESEWAKGLAEFQPNPNLIKEEENNQIRPLSALSHCPPAPEAILIMTTT